jgi:hypothetical protein
MSICEQAPAVVAVGFIDPMKQIKDVNLKSLEGLISRPFRRFGIIDARMRRDIFKLPILGLPLQ